jgi:hypothetical protein
MPLFRCAGSPASLPRSPPPAPYGPRQAAARPTPRPHCPVCAPRASPAPDRQHAGPIALISASALWPAWRPIADSPALVPPGLAEAGLDPAVRPPARPASARSPARRPHGLDPAVRPPARIASARSPARRPSCPLASRRRGSIRPPGRHRASPALEMSDIPIMARLQRPNPSAAIPANASNC